MKIKLLRCVLSFSVLILCLACSRCDQPHAQEEEKIRIVTTIMPLAYLIEAIGGDRISITVIVPAGANLHTYEPVPTQMKALGKADLYVKVGSGIEFELAWMDKITRLNRKIAVCDASKGIRLIPMTGHNCGSTDAENGHYHGKGDPHIWLSPNNAVLMARNIRDALIGLDPLNEAFYMKNFSVLAVKLDSIKREIQDKLSGLENRKFLVFHPAWGYFADDFGLLQISAECSGKEPTPRQLKALIKQARHEAIRVVFVSPQFSRKSSKVIADEIGGRIMAIDPLSGDYINNLRETAEAFIESKT
jgi:zinc transport system substrate-binding protein